ncbi:Small-conductance mechanosensitive channel [Enhygromyxa salina]|uniref:Small-conductance mechanosensitive channel n=1 Tax=Enhygromyxa salina TaxID=215803 RepID=A0A2S9YEW6_9BACT|nr:mechanosensitive ion channel family protein [Enhygromyxa salina]PRQ03649.1 Small-conductance mechanosensitive channel [Enhygromyxa salina]
MTPRSGGRAPWSERDSLPPWLARRLQPGWRMPDSLIKALDALGAKLQGWLEGAVSMAPNFVLAVLVVLAGAVLARYVSRGATRALDRLISNEALARLLGSIIHVSVIAIGLFAALSLLHLERTVTSLLAGLGVVGLALGFAFKDIAANFMSGAFLAVHGPFRPGDIIEFQGHIGEVEEVELRVTTLRTFDGLTVIIPNKEVFTETIVNYTRTEERRVDVAVGVAYGDDLERTEAAVCAGLEQLELRDATREIEVLFTEFGASSINFEARVWLERADQREYLRARSRAIILIKQAMDEAGLTIPFPIRTLDFGADESGGTRFDEMHLALSEGTQS